MNNKKGFTLVELIVVIVLSGFIISIALNMMSLPVMLQGKAIEESDVQGKMRILSQQVNHIVRDSSALFALHRMNDVNLTDEWDYIAPSPDHTSVIHYKWNGSSHDQIVVLQPQDGVTFDLVFKKLTPAQQDRLLEYTLIANINGQEREIQTQVEALNSLQVVDKGNNTNPANTLAFRSDPRITARPQVQAAVAMVFDKSGSMDWKMNGYDDSNDSSSNQNNWSRMKKLKIEAVRLVNNLSASNGIFASLVPFNYTANDPGEMLQVRSNETANDVLINSINSMSANGATNTGDGLRRGYYAIKNYSESTDITTKNFLIVLVDGCTTAYSTTRVSTDRWGNISSVNYFFNDNNIENREISDYNRDYPNGRYAGDLGSLDAEGTEYVDQIGTKIRQFGVSVSPEEEPISVYVIGFSAVTADHGSLRDIAEATTGNTTYYTAGDNAALEAIFSEIQTEIFNSLWVIGGPN